MMLGMGIPTSQSRAPRIIVFCVGGGWQLWPDIAANVAMQGDLFDASGGAKQGARYHEGASPKRQALPVAALRLAVLAEVACFIEVNQP